MIVAGLGFRGAALRASLEDALARAAHRDMPDALATPDDKTDHPALRELAAALGLPVFGIDAAVLASTRTLTYSPASQAARGTGSVAEATALAAAGAGARLIGPRQISHDRMASCALAKGETV